MKVLSGRRVAFESSKICICCPWFRVIHNKRRPDSLVSSVRIEYKVLSTHARPCHLDTHYSQSFRITRGPERSTTWIDLQVSGDGHWRKKSARRTHREREREREAQTASARWWDVINGRRFLRIQNSAGRCGELIATRHFRGKFARTFAEWIKKVARHDY